VETSFSSRLHLHLLACHSVAPSGASRANSRARLGSRFAIVVGLARLVVAEICDGVRHDKHATCAVPQKISLLRSQKMPIEEFPQSIARHDPFLIFGRPRRLLVP
jgi:hypothetical protein